MNGKVADTITLSKVTGCGPVKVNISTKDGKVVKIGCKMGKGGT